MNTIGVPEIVRSKKTLMYSFVNCYDLNENYTTDFVPTLDVLDLLERCGYVTIRKHSNSLTYSCGLTWIGVEVATQMQAEDVLSTCKKDDIAWLMRTDVDENGEALEPTNWWALHGSGLVDVNKKYRVFFDDIEDVEMRKKCIEESYLVLTKRGMRVRAWLRKNGMPDAKEGGE